MEFQLLSTCVDVGKEGCFIDDHKPARWRGRTGQKNKTLVVSKMPCISLTVRPNLPEISNDRDQFQDTQDNRNKTYEASNGQESE